MKSVEVIQEVKILPRAQASHQPCSETRWREEPHVMWRHVGILDGKAMGFPDKGSPQGSVLSPL